MIGVGAAVALAVGGTGVAVAIGGSGDGEQEGPPVAASVATKAGAAALKATGGGSVTEVERDSENGATYGVEVKLPDGSSVDVYLDNAFAPVGKPVADDAGTGDRGDGDGETNDD
jgi:hypothetical protein